MRGINPSKVLGTESFSVRTRGVFLKKDCKQKGMFHIIGDGAPAPTITSYSRVNKTILDKIEKNRRMVTLFKIL